MKSFCKRVYQTIKYSIQRVDIGAQSAQLAFYLLMSLVPLLLIVSNLIPLLPISSADLMTYLDTILPNNVRQIIETMLTSYLNSYSSSSLSFGVIVALWSSSQAFNVMQRVFCSIYNTKPRQNVIIMRLMSLFMSCLFIFLIVFVGLMLAYGGSILRLMQEFTLIREGIDVIFDHFKWIVASVILATVLGAIYYVMPNVKWKLRFVLPGAIFSTIGILVASQAYSVYISFATSSALTDGTIGIFIVLILWLYLISMVILFGAWINVLYYDYKYIPFIKERLYEEKWVTHKYYSKHFTMNTLEMRHEHEKK
ncbi:MULTISPECIES: YihY/virulence factor BrkB family protein [unclassified Granulicatella]|uniref:YihY/virulence factor BrkB family protein n=1 Tax=unclassified Granulicatella TaxID=2630493 RepID=UPI00107430E3|nr:YihY/virulence factor BrkB family protein [Granulicatella sp. WM01]MBF0780285.1 YihY/virulence factor BrkB family protein [Granulicatella sp. 19428wC4_WM01]TFU95564.1 YihY/virulence factor BrkB family protein [Granulicatella sp. WM01]